MDWNFNTNIAKYFENIYGFWKHLGNMFWDIKLEWYFIGFYRQEENIRTVCPKLISLHLHYKTEEYHGNRARRFSALNPTQPIYKHSSNGAKKWQGSWSVKWTSIWPSRDMVCYSHLLSFLSLCAGLKPAYFLFCFREVDWLER